MYTWNIDGLVFGDPDYLTALDLAVKLALLLYPECRLPYEKWAVKPTWEYMGYVTNSLPKHRNFNNRIDESNRE